MMSGIRLVRYSVLLAVFMVLLGWVGSASVASAAVVGDPAGDGTHVWVSDMGWWQSTGASGSIRPTAVAVDGEDHLYITDNKNATGTVHVYSQTTGSFIASWSVEPTGFGYSNPQDIAVDDDNNVYVLRTKNNSEPPPYSTASYIEQYSQTGEYLRAWSVADCSRIHGIEATYGTDGVYALAETGSDNKRVVRFDASGSQVAYWQLTEVGSVWDLALSAESTAGAIAYVTSYNEGGVRSYTLPAGPPSLIASYDATGADLNSGLGVEWCGSYGETGSVFTGEKHGTEWTLGALVFPSRIATMAGHEGTGTLGTAGPLQRARRIAGTEDGRSVYVSDNGNNRVVRFIQVPRCELRFVHSNPTSQGANAFEGRVMATAPISGVSVLFVGADATVTRQASVTAGAFDSEDETFTVDAPDGVWQRVYAAPKYSDGTTWTDMGDWGHVSGTITIDSTPPETTSTAILASYNSAATATLTAIDSVSGVANTKWRIDAGEWTMGTAVTMPAIPGTHTLQWTSTDLVGNAETARAVTYEMLGRVDNLDERIVYHGAWTTGTNALRYNGSWKTASASDQKAYVAFTGSRFDLIGSKAPNYGIAKITIDSTSAYADFYASDWHHQQLIYTREGLTSGTHTAVIEWTGTKDDSSTGYYIGLDAVDVAQLDQAVVRYEDGVSLLVYEGPWATGSNAGRSAGAWRYAETTATSYVAFTGTGFDLIGSVGPAYGIAKVTVDSTTTPAYVDYYAADYAHQQYLYSLFGLGDTTHTVVVEWTGTKNAASSGYLVGVDALDVAGTLNQARPPTTRFEETDSLMLFDRTWLTGNNAARSAGAWRYAETTGSVCYIEFEGTGFDLIGSVGPAYGIAKVTVDSTTTPAYVDYYAADCAHQQYLYSLFNLSDTTHTVTVEPMESKDASSTGYLVGVDAVDVAGSLSQPVVRYEDTDAMLVYEGSWATGNNAARSAGAWRYAETTGSVCYIEFEGTGFDLIGSVGPAYGIAKVTVDSTTTPAYVDYYAADYAHQQNLYSLFNLSDTTHTVTIERIGSKNASSTGYLIGVDAVEVAGMLSQATTETP